MSEATKRTTNSWPKGPPPGSQPTLQYRLTTASNPGALEAQVAQAIKEGWRPQGGVAIDEYYDLVQALVKEG